MPSDVAKTKAAQILERVAGSLLDETDCAEEILAEEIDDLLTQRGSAPGQRVEFKWPTHFRVTFSDPSEDVTGVELISNPRVVAYDVRVCDDGKRIVLELELDKLDEIVTHEYGCGCRHIHHPPNKDGEPWCEVQPCDVHRPEIEVLSFVLPTIRLGAGESDAE